MSSVAPESVRLNLLVSVISVDVVVRSEQDAVELVAAEVTVGDETGTIVLSARGKEQVDKAAVPGALLELHSARVVMVQGYMRLVVDRWGQIIAAPSSTSPPQVNLDVASASDIEYAETV